MFVLSILFSRSLQVRSETALWQHSLVYLDVETNSTRCAARRRDSTEVESIESLGGSMAL